MKFLTAYSPSENHYYMMQYEELKTADAEKDFPKEYDRRCGIHYIDGYRLVALKDKVYPLDVINDIPLIYSKNLKYRIYIPIEGDLKIDDSEFEFLEFDNYDDAILYYLAKFNL